MWDNYVEFAATKRVEAWVPEPDKYQFKPVGWLGFFQRWCFSWLEWCGALKSTSRHTVEYIHYRIDTDDLVKQLLAQYDDMLQYHHPPKRVLIGSQDFSELMKVPEMQQYCNFEAKCNYGRSIIGLQIEVIPWMRGVIVMP